MTDLNAEAWLAERLRPLVDMIDGVASKVIEIQSALNGVPGDHRFVELDRLVTELELLQEDVRRLQVAAADPAPPVVAVDPPAPIPVNPPLDLARPSVGINLGQLSYYVASYPYPDLMRYAQQADEAGAWLQPAGSIPLPLDADRYPLSVVSPQYAETLVAKVGGHYRGGAYTLSWQGRGSIRLSGDTNGVYTSGAAGVQVVMSPAGTRVQSVPVNVTPSPAGISVRIVASDTADHVRAIALSPVGAPVLDPAWIARREPFGVLRFMDWGRTNDSPHVEWAGRRTMNERTWAGARGVPYEAMIEAANAALSHPWVCVPHRADRDYVERMAALFATTLDSRLTPIVEFSNEVWNWGFGQAKDVAAGGNVHANYARRAVEVFQWWKNGAGFKRTVRVLSGQAANPDVGKQILTAVDNLAGELQCDAYACAPYFGGKVDLAQPLAAQLDALKLSVEEQGASMRANVAMARSFGLPTIAYEGGQHVLPASDARVPALRALQERPEMEALYTRYLSLWREAGGGLFCAFNDVQPTSRSGAWGMWEWDGAPETPKSRAVLATAKAWAG